ncbi:hypothetical protein ABFS83_02G025200 [Erythranthe nasuta]
MESKKNVGMFLFAVICVVALVETNMADKLGSDVKIPVNCQGICSPNQITNCTESCRRRGSIDGNCVRFGKDTLYCCCL